jgi:exodeoxyribonuclease VII large subunit
MHPIDISHTEEIYTVSRLNREVRFTLENHFPLLWVEGEISNFSAPHSGHWYFSLKDTTAQVRCAMFRPQNRRLNFTPKEGMHVILKARISLYEGRGDFQLLVEHIEDAGVGKLQKAFEALKKKLAEAGLFSNTHKKPIPLFPNCIGVITSPTGAAIKDIISVLKRRFSSAPIIIYPTLVQGELAAANIVNALQIANQRQECDVIILARGGGSLEDLWPFNEENVAHAIFNSTIPIISGVGHEIDYTIADFVADIRAPTPSVAAEIATPDINKLVESLAYHQTHLLRLIKQTIISLQQKISWAQKHLQQQHPKRRLAEQQQRLDYCEMALVQLQNKLLHKLTAHTQNLKEKLFANTPKHLIRDFNHRMETVKTHLQTTILIKLKTYRQIFDNTATQLHTLSPLTTLQRGFAIVTSEKLDKVVSSYKEVHMGDKVHIRLSEGKLNCIVQTSEPVKNS